MEEKESINENQTINEETPVEKETKQNKNIETSILIEKPAEDDKSYGEVVEEERLKIVKASKRSTILSTISIILVMAISVTGLFLLNVNQILAFSLMGVALFVLILFTILIKRIARPDVKGYMTKALEAVNKFTYADNRFSDASFDPTEKVQLEDVTNDGVYSDLRRVASRNVVEGYFKGRSFKVSEVAFFKPQENRREKAAFIGKYLVTQNDLHFEGRIVLIKKGSVDTDLPDAIDDLVKIEGEQYFYAYGPKDNSLKELNKKFVQAIKNFDVEGHLMNLIVVLWAGKTIAYLSYDDATMTIPYDKKYQEDTAVQARNNLIDLLEAAELLRE